MQILAKAIADLVKYPKDWTDHAVIVLKDGPLTSAEKRAISLRGARAWRFAASSVLAGLALLSFVYSVHVLLDPVRFFLMQATWLFVAYLAFRLMIDEKKPVGKNKGADFVDSASCTVAVLAVSFPAASFAAAIGYLLVQVAASPAASWIVPSLTFLGVQCAMIYSLLSRRLRYAHGAEESCEKRLRPIAIGVLTFNLFCAVLPQALQATPVNPATPVGPATNIYREPVKNWKDLAGFSPYCGERQQTVLSFIPAGSDFGHDTLSADTKGAQHRLEEGQLYKGDGVIVPSPGLVEGLAIARPVRPDALAG